MPVSKDGAGKGATDYSKQPQEADGGRERWGKWILVLKLDGGGCFSLCPELAFTKVAKHLHLHASGLQRKKK